MPKLYCRVNLRTDLEKRHRAGQLFTRTWRELDGVDAATLAALQEDPYLEVSDTPTVQIEVAAGTQAGAIETEQDQNNPVKSLPDEGSTGDAAQGSDTGTASPVANVGDEIQTGDDAPAADAADSGADGTAATDGEQPADAQLDEATQRGKLIAIAIGMLDQSNPEHWLKDGRPNLTAISTISGLTITAEERDAVWEQIKSDRSAG